MGVGLFELVIVVITVLVVGTVIVTAISKLFRGRGEKPTVQAARGVTLKCPHCGAETEAAKPQCQHCSKDL